MVLRRGRIRRPPLKAAPHSVDGHGGKLSLLDPFSAGRSLAIKGADDAVRFRFPSGQGNASVRARSFPTGTHRSLVGVLVVIRMIGMMGDF